MSDNAFGRWLEKQLEMRHNMSQAELARRASVTRSAINGVIHGDNPGIPLLKGIAKGLGIDEAEVFQAARVFTDTQNGDFLANEVKNITTEVSPGGKVLIRDFARMVRDRERNQGLDEAGESAR